MNEAETRAELIDPKLKACGWGVVEGSKVLREYNITAGKIQTGGGRTKPLIADYVLVYKGIKLAVIEAKSDKLEVGEGVAQAKQYAEKLKLDTAYSTNGKEIYSICMKTGAEGLVDNYLTPEELWKNTYPSGSETELSESWREKFSSVPFEDKGGTWQLRYYQEIAIKNTLEAVAFNKDRILLTLATGTGKTAIAFQIAWKLFQTRWNLKRDGSRRPRILFLADRNILADQAYNAFSAFPEDALARIKPDEIRRTGKVPTNGSIFFTIFQTFMSGGSTSSPTDLKEISKIEDVNAYTYILECADGSFYTGSTINLKHRLIEHENCEGSEYTKSHLPIKLVYYETFNTIDKAFAREKQIQNWSRAKTIALINQDVELLQQLSKNKTNGSVPEPVEGYFGEYPNDYFDFIIIDECHRGGANNEGNWRGILEYFKPAVQLGLTATPKRRDNVDTYKYFGEPVYIYSLKEGINDGYLTPFKVKRVQTTMDNYIYVSDDKVIEGEIEEGREYTEPDFNRIIEIRAREAKRVQVLLSQINQNEKAIVFCANQEHAAAIRDLINQYKKNNNPNYCVRVTANDGAIGEQFLRDFKDNEKTIPTILTTSQKLSTGVDARNIRNIVLLRTINSMIEFKQIIGRGTRLFDGKEYFTIYDFVGAYHHFIDPEWDGEPIEPEPYPESKSKCDNSKQSGINENNDEYGKKETKRKKIKIKLRDGKEREIQHMIATYFYSADGKTISAEAFLQNLYGILPDFFKSEDELRNIWSDPATRKALLEKLSQAGFGREELTTLQKLIDAEKSDLFDVLEYVSFSIKPISRELRVNYAKPDIFKGLNEKQKEFLEFVLSKYIETGVEELAQEKLPQLLELKYHAITDASAILGGVEKIKQTFIAFQKFLYSKKVA